MNAPKQPVSRGEASPDTGPRPGLPERAWRGIVQFLGQVPSRVWATVASVAALTSVLGPSFFYDHTIYDASLAILTITAIAVIWYTAFSYELVSAMWTDREERAADREESKVERRARLRIVVISASRILGRLAQSANEQEILSRVDWFERIEQLLGGFVGLDDGEYDIELMLAAEALLELRIQTESALKGNRVPDGTVGGERDDLTHLLDEAEDALVKLYARLTDQKPEEVAPGIPK